MNQHTIEMIDLIDRQELLFLFQNYVNYCVEKQQFPVSFEEWKKDCFDESTMVKEINVQFQWERAERGQLVGTQTVFLKVKIPAFIVSDSGEVVDTEGMKRLCRKLVIKRNERLPVVNYKGKSYYRWSWN